MPQKKLIDAVEDASIIENRLIKLYEQIQKCEGCGLSKLEVNQYRPRIKFGKKPILIVSQNPSVFRDGLPHVWGGLDKLMKNLPSSKISTLREVLDMVYVTNIVKCSTPGNRSPTRSEVNACFRWLQKEVEIISPVRIIVLGSVARDGIYNRFPGIPTFFLKHPISAVRNGDVLDYSVKLMEVIYG